MYLFSLPCRQVKNCFVHQTKGVAFTNIISLLVGRTCCFVFCSFFSPLMILQFFVPFQPFFALHSCYFCLFLSNLYQHWTRPFSIHFCLLAQQSILHELFFDQIVSSAVVLQVTFWIFSIFDHSTCSKRSKVCNGGAKKIFSHQH